MPPDYKSVIKMNGEAHDEVSLDNKKNVLAYSITNHNPHELSDSSSTVSNEPFTFISRIKPTFPLGAPEFLDTSIDNHYKSTCNLILFPDKKSNFSTTLEYVILEKYRALLDHSNEVYEQLVQIKKSITSTN